ncbi:glycoside hydrolase family 5 protein [Rhodofomes roseus]|uniref:mannan endo-1,4-beta-mannosidase n=1 Tax=Rhodofomes roseus TaxID=34475 RepID=A0ABQ8KSY2_9APHY|nr:glycoside hydrolase family 5 protein [Rhodofomes roseus]KAH9841925.1 glycoside hydrolase family 5 protein [Rhodofomes roseus]
MFASTASKSVFGLCAFALLLSAQVAQAGNSFAGSSLYYAAGLYEDDRTTLLKGMQSAGLKVLRVWLDGQSSSQKGTKLNPFNELEPKTPCNGDASCYDDTVLERLDDFMVAANSYGVKLLITMHSFNALGNPDAYGKKYGKGDFYSNNEAQTAFDARLEHILNHNHTSLSKPWKELKDYVFAFEAENEAMIGNGESFVKAHQQWQCDRAGTIKGQLGNDSGILVTTGGESWLSESVQPGFLSCDALDVISIHAYGTGDLATSALKPYVAQAQAAGKMLMVEEWGACYFDTSNNDCPKGDALDADTRSGNIINWAEQIDNAGLPWLYWQVLPNADPHGDYDYEIAMDGSDAAAWSALQQAAKSAANATAAFDFSAYLL